MSSWVCGLPLAHHFSFKQIVMKNTDHLGMNESNLNLYNRASNYYKYLKSQSQKKEKVRANQIQMTLIRKADLKWLLIMLIIIYDIYWIITMYQAFC